MSICSTTACSNVIIQTRKYKAQNIKAFCVSRVFLLLRAADRWACSSPKQVLYLSRRRSTRRLRLHYLCLPEGLRAVHKEMYVFRFLSQHNNVYYLMCIIDIAPQKTTLSYVCVRAQRAWQPLFVLFRPGASRLDMFRCASSSACNVCVAEDNKIGLPSRLRPNLAENTPLQCSSKYCTLTRPLLS